MTAASSISTYLQVVGAASPTMKRAPDVVEIPASMMTDAAKLLASLNDGPSTIAEMREKSGLDPTTILTTLGVMAQAKLVRLDGEPLRAELTEPVKAALASA
jgi:hypothetical protein